MTIEDFKILIENTLSNQEEIFNIFQDEKTLLVSTDESNFFINILESKNMFANNNEDSNYITEYMSAHSKEEFIKDLRNKSAVNSGFLFYFLMLLKLEEMNIIDNNLLYHIINNIIYHEHVFNEFFDKILSYFGK